MITRHRIVQILDADPDTFAVIVCDDGLQLPVGPTWCRVNDPIEGGYLLSVGGLWAEDDEGRVRYAPPDGNPV